MAKKKRFPLKMQNGAEVGTLYELRENFDLNSILDYFYNGKLQIWLSDRYYNEKAEMIGKISPDTDNIKLKLCELFGIDTIITDSDEINNKTTETVESVDKIRNGTDSEIKNNEYTNYVENPDYFTNYNSFLSEYIFYSKERGVIRKIVPFIPSSETIFAVKLRNGVAFEYDGQPFQIIHIQPYGGFSFRLGNINAKCINIITGDVVKKEFSSSDDLKTISIDSVKMIYSYTENGIYSFKDKRSGKIMSVLFNRLPFSFRFIKSGTVCDVLTYNDRIISVLPPEFVDLKVVGFSEKGQYSRNYSGKCAVLETGAEIKVPSTVEEGDIIKIDTIKGEYISSYNT